MKERKSESKRKKIVNDFTVTDLLLDSYASSLRIEHQAPQLDTLPPSLTLISPRIDKRRMWHSSRHSIPLLRIITLDQQTLIRRLLRHVPPFVVLVWPDVECSAFEGRIYVSRSHEIARGVDGTPVDDAEGGVCDGIGYRTPYVDEAETGLEEDVGSFGEVATDSFSAGFEGLVDVDALL